MSDQQDNQQSSSLDRVSDELLRSLRRCHVMMNDYRSKLTAANSNEPGFMLAGAEKEDEETA